MSISPRSEIGDRLHDASGIGCGVVSAGLGWSWVRVRERLVVALWAWASVGSWGCGVVHVLVHVLRASPRVSRVRS